MSGIGRICFFHSNNERSLSFHDKSKNENLLVNNLEKESSKDSLKTLSGFSLMRIILIECKYLE